MNAWDAEPISEKVTRPRIDESKIKSTIQTSGKKIESDVFYALAPIYYVSWIFGLFPVKFSKNSTGQYIGRLQNVNVLHGFFILIGVVGAQCWGLYRDLRDGREYSLRMYSQMGIISTSGDLISITGVFALAIIGSSFRWRHIMSALDVIVLVDEKLGIATSKNLRKDSIIMITCSIIYLITFLSSYLIVFSYSFEKSKKHSFEDKGLINYSPMYSMYMVILTFEMQYAIVLFNVGERFLKLNKAIQNLIKTNDVHELVCKGMRLAFLSSNSRKGWRNNVPNLMVSDEGYEDVSDSINVLITLHGKLCDCIEYINEAYGFALLMATISCFIHLTTVPYYLWILIFNYGLEWEFILFQNLWIIFHTYLLLLLVQPCYMIAVKAKATGTLVSKAMAQNWDPKVKKQWEIFSLQLILRPVEFTVCGLFYLNRGLITTMASGVTTYLVILMQFRGSESDIEETKQLLKNVIESIKNASIIKNQIL